MASGFDSEHIAFVHSCDPAWFFHPHGHDVQSLQNLTLVDLKPAVVHVFSVSDSKIKHNKSIYIDAILKHFVRMNTYFISLTNDKLFPYIQSHVASALETDTRLVLISKYFDAVYGITVSAALRTPIWSFNTGPHRFEDVCIQSMPWLAHDISKKK